MNDYGFDDALTLACKAWLQSPHTTRGTLTIKLNPWYGRIVADVVHYEEEEKI